jgi:AbiV family abortive infection protein
MMGAAMNAVSPVGPTLSAEDLLHGALYALEHAGSLLTDAVTLWQTGRFSSALVLGVFAHEELGRFRILVQERAEALKTGVRDLKQVRKACSDHVAKLRAAPGPQSFSYDPNLPGLAGLQEAPHTQAFHAAHAILEELATKAREAFPSQSHAKRLAALYVDYDEGLTTWRQPKATEQGASGRILLDLRNSYAGCVERVLEASKDPELHQAYLNWPSHPTFPPPVHPEPITLCAPPTLLR